MLNSAGNILSGKIQDLPASKITSGTFNTARLGSGTASGSTFLSGTGWVTPPPPPPGRTLLRSTTSNDWTANFSVRSFTVADIDNFDYLTFALIGASGSGTELVAETTTFPTALLPVDSTPAVGDPALSISHATLSQFYFFSRNSAGTLIYVKPATTFTGRVAAIWGGDF